MLCIIRVLFILKRMSKNQIVYWHLYAYDDTLLFLAFKLILVYFQHIFIVYLMKLLVPMIICKLISLYKERFYIEETFPWKWVKSVIMDGNDLMVYDHIQETQVDCCLKNYFKHIRHYQSRVMSG